MRRSPYAVALALAALLSTGPAGASGCPLVSDPAGDGGPFGIASVNPSLDVVSADVASSATTLVGVIRVRALDVDDPSVLFARWAVSWDANGTHYGLLAKREFGELALSGWLNGPFAPRRVSVAVDEAAGAFTVTAPRSALPEPAGATFEGFGALASEPLTAQNDFADAVSGTTYVDGTAGCIPAA